MTTNLPKPKKQRKAIFIVEEPAKDADGFNIVTDAEIKAFEGMIFNLARSFAAMNGKGAGFDDKTTVVSINRSGWTSDDLKQELRVAVWLALKNYDKDKALTAFGLCSKENFVRDCLKNRMGQLADNMWATKRGNKVSHVEGDDASNLMDAYSIFDQDL